MQKKEKLIEQNLNKLFSAYFTHDDESLILSIKKIIDSSNQTIIPINVYNKIFEQVKKVSHDESFSPSSTSELRTYKGKLHPTSARDEWRQKNKEINNKTEVKKNTFKIDKLFIPEKVSKRISTLEKQYHNRKELEMHGLQAVNRILLVGDPGGGKTSLAKQIALDLDLKMNMHSIASIIDSALGGTGKQIHNIFNNASSQLLFLDEFDSIGSSRKRENDLGEMSRVVNVLLQEMDNLDDNTFLIAATNFPKRLDAAILRRFPVIIELPKPDLKNRVDYMNDFFARHNIKVNKNEISKVAKLTERQSYADLKAFMTNYAIEKISEQHKDLRLSNFFIEELSMREIINDRKLAEWVNQKSISITDLAGVLDIPRTTLSDRLKRVGDINNEN